MIYKNFVCVKKLNIDNFIAFLFVELFHYKVIYFNDMKIYLYNLAYKIVEKCLKQNISLLELGDAVHVGIILIERNKTRIQFYIGNVAVINGSNRNTTRTIQRFDSELVVERTFFLHSHLTEYKVVRK